MRFVNPASTHQLFDICRGGSLAGERSRIVYAGVERMNRPAQRVDGERGRNVCRAGDLLGRG